MEDESEIVDEESEERTDDEMIDGLIKQELLDLGVHLDESGNMEYPSINDLLVKLQEEAEPIEVMEVHVEQEIKLHERSLSIDDYFGESAEGLATLLDASKSLREPDVLEDTLFKTQIIEPDHTEKNDAERLKAPRNRGMSLPADSRARGQLFRGLLSIFPSKGVSGFVEKLRLELQGTALRRLESEQYHIKGRVNFY